MSRIVVETIYNTDGELIGFDIPAPLLAELRCVASQLAVREDRRRFIYLLRRLSHRDRGTLRLGIDGLPPTMRASLRACFLELRGKLEGEVATQLELRLPLLNKIMGVSAIDLLGELAS